MWLQCMHGPWLDLCLLCFKKPIMLWRNALAIDLLSIVLKLCIKNQPVAMFNKFDVLSYLSHKFAITFEHHHGLGLSSFSTTKVSNTQELSGTNPEINQGGGWLRFQVGSHIVLWALP